MPQIVKETVSLCPVCLKTVPAIVLKKDDNFYLRKICEEHGAFETVIWRGKPEYEEWVRPKSAAHPKTPNTEVSKGCPYDCGLCREHRQHTCTALIEVTSRCNLKCKFCFADSSPNGSDPALETIELWYKKLSESAENCNLQISGGEPTVREDLPDIIAKASDNGFKFIQLNTNGMKLADYDYYKKLKEAGLKSIFLQFDGLNGDIIKNLRGKDILNQKLKAIENSHKLGVGVILVCTVVPHVNDEMLWDIIKFGLENSPAVRGVHFQPVSYFGRVPHIPTEDDRITLPEVMSKIANQSENRIKLSDFGPSGCENALCSFHANYTFMDGRLIPVSKKHSCCGVENGKEGSRKTIKFVENNWSGIESSHPSPKKYSFEELNQKIKNGFFIISCMAFQDVWNVDLERLKDCCIHVVSKEGNLIPFCAYNITSLDDKKLYR